MAQINTKSSFHSWQLTPQEIINGSILSGVQKMCIQNQISVLAEERISLLFDPNNPLPFQQRDAELQGQMNALRYLISLSEDAEREVLQGASQLPSGE